MHAVKLQRDGEEEEDPGPDEYSRHSSTPAVLPGLSLYEASRHAGSTVFKEDPNMQQMMLVLLSAIAEAVKCDAHVMDTHNSTHQLYNPVRRPDFTLLSERAPVPAWPQVVGNLEINLGTGKNELDLGLGKLVQQSAAALTAQPGRESIVTALITMNTIEMIQFKADPNARDGALQMYTTDLLPFSISQESSGFQALVLLLATPKAALGFRKEKTPALHLDGMTLSNFSLLRRGSVGSLLKQGSSYVYSVEVCESMPGMSAAQQPPSSAVVKLNQETLEGDLLHELQGTEHIIKLLGRGTCNFAGALWQVVLISPLIRLLVQDDPVKLVAQMVSDVASAIGDGWVKKRILQRDITPRNFGHHEHRGFLMDYSVGKMPLTTCMYTRKFAHGEEHRPPSTSEAITGTMLWILYTILCGNPQSVSSQLEGLFISIYSISCNGRISRRNASSSCNDWARLRLSQFGFEEIGYSERIVPALRPLISKLHDLFWKVGDNKQRFYQRNVTVEQAGCMPGVHGRRLSLSLSLSGCTPRRVP